MMKKFSSLIVPALLCFVAVFSSETLVAAEAVINEATAVTENDLGKRIPKRSELRGMSIDEFETMKAEAYRVREINPYAWHKFRKQFYLDRKGVYVPREKRILRAE